MTEPKRYRLLRLLISLDEHSFKPLPANVGLKTVNMAKEHGYVVVDQLDRQPTCKLTTKGKSFRQNEKDTMAYAVAARPRYRAGRPALGFMPTTVRLPVDLLIRVDASLGRKSRATFIREALEAHLLSVGNDAKTDAGR